MPAEPEMPWALQPPAITNPLTRRLSPMMNRPSGVNVGQPLPMRVRAAPRASGKRRANSSSKPSSTAWSASTTGADFLQPVAARVDAQGVRLPAAEPQALPGRATVQGHLGDAEARQARVQPGKRDRVVVLVPHGDDGELETREAGDVIRVRARRVDDRSAAHLAAVRLHRGDAAVATGDPRDRRPRLEAHAHAPAAALVRLRHRDGRHVPVGGTPEHRLGGAGDRAAARAARPRRGRSGRPRGRPARRRPAAAAVPRRAGERTRCGSSRPRASPAEPPGPAAARGTSGPSASRAARGPRSSAPARRARRPARW